VSLLVGGDVVSSDGEISRRLALASQAITRLSLFHIRPDISAGGLWAWRLLVPIRARTENHREPVLRGQRSLGLGGKHKVPRKSSSHQTLCWREMDSNHRYLARRSRFRLRKANCGGSNGGSPKVCFFYGVPAGSACSHRRRDAGRDTPVYLLDLRRPSDRRRARRVWRRARCAASAEITPCVYDERPRLPVGLALR
jgi:hypothetical protein